jgi:hypothetical protein
MRFAVIGSALLVAGCSSTPVDNTQPLARACSVADCFLQRDVRDFEVIDPTTVVVYVGGQRCPFEIDLRGTFCDMTFAPAIFFRSPNDPESQDRDIFGETRGSLGGQRICSNDLQIGVDGGVFTENTTTTQPSDRFGNPRSQCQVAGISSLTDDQLVELYVQHGKVAPPPPMGSGQIEVQEKKDEEGGATPPESGDAPPPSSASGETAATAPETGTRLAGR